MITEKYVPLKDLKPGTKFRTEAFGPELLERVLVKIVLDVPSHIQSLSYNVCDPETGLTYVLNPELKVIVEHKRKLRVNFNPNDESQSYTTPHTFWYKEVQEINYLFKKYFPEWHITLTD